MQTMQKNQHIHELQERLTVAQREAERRISDIHNRYTYIRQELAGSPRVNPAYSPKTSFQEPEQRPTGSVRPYISAALIARQQGHNASLNASRIDQNSSVHQGNNTSTSMGGNNQSVSQFNVSFQEDILDPKNQNAIASAQSQLNQNNQYAIHNANNAYLNLPLKARSMVSTQLAGAAPPNPFHRPSSKRSSSKSNQPQPIVPPISNMSRVTPDIMLSPRGLTTPSIYDQLVSGGNRGSGGSQGGGDAAQKY